MDKNIFMNNKNLEKFTEEKLDFSKLNLSQTADEQYREQLTRHEVDEIKNYNGNVKKLTEGRNIYPADFLEFVDLLDNCGYAITDDFKTSDGKYTIFRIGKYEYNHEAIPLEELKQKIDDYFDGNVNFGTSYYKYNPQVKDFSIKVDSDIFDYADEQLTFDFYESKKSGSKKLTEGRNIYPADFREFADLLDNCGYAITAESETSGGKYTIFRIGKYEYNHEAIPLEELKQKIDDYFDGNVNFGISFYKYNPQVKDFSIKVDSDIFDYADEQLTFDFYESKKSGSKKLTEGRNIYPADFREFADLLDNCGYAITAESETSGGKYTIFRIGKYEYNHEAIPLEELKQKIDDYFDGNVNFGTSYYKYNPQVKDFSIKVDSDIFDYADEQLTFDFYESKKSGSKKLTENVNEHNIWNIYDLCEDALGSVELFLSICKALDFDILKDSLIYINRIYDLDIEIDDIHDKGELIDTVMNFIDTNEIDYMDACLWFAKALGTWKLIDTLEFICKMKTGKLIDTLEFICRMNDIPVDEELEEKLHEAYEDDTVLFDSLYDEFIANVNAIGYAIKAKKSFKDNVYKKVYDTYILEPKAHNALNKDLAIRELKSVFNKEEIKDKNVVIFGSRDSANILASFEKGFFEPGTMTESLKEANLKYKYKVVFDNPNGTHWQFKYGYAKFKTEEEAKACVESTMKKLPQSALDKGVSVHVEEIQPVSRKKKEIDTDFANPFKEGDILYGDVGITMEIPEFYKVMKATNHYVTCRRLQTKSDTGASVGYATPMENLFSTRNGEFEECRMHVEKGYGRNGYCAILGRRYVFNLWDGKPQHYDHND